MRVNRNNRVQKVIRLCIGCLTLFYISCSATTSEADQEDLEASTTDEIQTASSKPLSERYQIEEPSLEFNTVEGWEDLSANWSDGNLKFHRVSRVRAGKIDGVVRIVRDVYVDQIMSIEALDYTEEKLSFQREAPIQDFKLSFVTLNGVKHAEYAFNVEINTKSN